MLGGGGDLDNLTAELVKRKLKDVLIRHTLFDLLHISTFTHAKHFWHARHEYKNSWVKIAGSSRFVVSGVYLTHFFDSRMSEIDAGPHQ